MAERPKLSHVWQGPCLAGLPNLLPPPRPPRPCQGTLSVFPCRPAPNMCCPGSTSRFFKFSIFVLGIDKPFWFIFKCMPYSCPWLPAPGFFVKHPNPKQTLWEVE